MSDTPRIAGIDIGTAGFVGDTERGPAAPTVVTNWGDFVQAFGGFVDQSPLGRAGGYLPYAVRGYFENGGRQAIVARAPWSDGLRAIEQGLDALLARDEVSLVVVADHGAVQGATDLLVARSDAAGWPFAVLATAHPLEEVSLLLPPHDSKNAAIYYPWLRVPAPHRPGGARVVPPVGHVAGIISRVARERGVHQAPANEAVVGLVGDPLSVRIAREDQDVLNQRGVNVIRDFTAAGRGVRVWGARTMSSDPEWRYVNVRRLVSYLERSIANGTRWVTFEPNTPPTWATLRTNIEDFLVQAWRDGALQGRKPEEAFFVRCDRTTMTQDDIDNGRLVCLVGVATVRPAEFVIVRIGQWTADRER